MRLYTAQIVHGPSRSTLRARRPRLLIVGCGDVGLRVLRELAGRWRVLAVTSSLQRVAELRAAGVTPIVANLDQPETLRRLGALAPRVLHLAPPSAMGAGDRRTQALLGAFARAGVVRRIVYASTSGVYGDAGGAWIDETTPLAPATERAKRRVAAEAALRGYGRRHAAAVTILRVPGIYAFDRVGGNPIERVRAGAPVLVRADDVHTNRIHADDLARACVAALCRGPAQRAINVCDDTRMLMGDVMDMVADHSGLQRPARVTRDDARRTLSPMAFSFLTESRRLRNERMKRELKLSLRYPTLRYALEARRVKATV